MKNTVKFTGTLLLALASIGFLSLPASRTAYATGGRPTAGSPTFDVIPKSTLLTASGGTTTTSPFFIGAGSSQGFDWDLTQTGTPALNVQILQSNSIAGPFVLWGTSSLVGTSATNNVTINTAQGGSDCKLLKSGYCEFKVTNNDTHDVTVNHLCGFNL